MLLHLSRSVTDEWTRDISRHGSSSPYVVALKKIFTPNPKMEVFSLFPASSHSTSSDVVKITFPAIVSSLGAHFEGAAEFHHSGHAPHPIHEFYEAVKLDRHVSFVGHLICGQTDWANFYSWVVAYSIEMQGLASPLVVSLLPYLKLKK
jgi:hypothetical protein